MILDMEAGMNSRRSCGMASRGVHVLAAFARAACVVGLVAVPASPGAHGADTDPAWVDATIDMKFKSRDPAWFDGDKLTIHYNINPIPEPNPDGLPQRSGVNWAKIFRVQGRFQAEISRTLKDGVAGPKFSRKYRTGLCLEWSRTPPPPGTPNKAAYQCAEDDPPGQCVPTAQDQGWLTQCSAPPQPASHGWNLIGAAHAQSAEAPQWIVPSLQTLERLRQASPEPQRPNPVGYTKFDVIAASPPAGADRAVVRVFVNGAELLVDGVDADYHPLRIDPGKKLTIAFGVQTLNMDGRYAGCNRIELLIAYYKGTQELLQHRIAQYYAALRNMAGATSPPQDGISYEWTGAYLKPKGQPEDVVLVASFADRNVIEKLQTKFNQAATPEGKPVLRAIIRPPLNDPPFFGLGAAILEDTGQLRFVFSPDDAKSIADEVMHRPGLKGIVSQPLILGYPRPKDQGLPGVCHVTNP